MKKLIPIVTLILCLIYSIPWAESALSFAVKADAGERIVTLSWPHQQSEEIKGYWIYRALSGEDYQRMNSVLLNETFYQDMDILPGQTYWYIVIATDHEGNKILSSEAIRVIITSAKERRSGY